MTDLAAIAQAAVAELRRLPCRRAHDVTPAAVLECPRCGVIYRWEMAERRTPTDAEHATNVQLSALLNSIEQDGWVRLDDEDVAWLREALGASTSPTGERGET